MKKTTLTSVLTLVCAIAFAQGPNNSGTYYNAANGKKGEALKTAMYGIISQKNSLTYDELWDKYIITDTRADGYVRDWYSNTTNFTHIADKAGSYKKEGDVYNREHLVPQSWGPPKADIVHVVPTDGYVNNRRGNLPLGEVGTISYQSNNGYSKVGTCKTAGFSGQVFEPNDEVKGDIARIYFYMATCYEGQANNWSGGMFGGTKYQPLAQWAFDMFLRWAKLDPVDDVERTRNNAVARADVQNNRNPFVDYPGLEDYIWGSKQDVAFSYDNYVEGGGDDPDPGNSVAQPEFLPNGGTFTGQVTVTMSTSTEGASIYYTTTGAEASENSKLYEAPITLTETTTLKAIAVKDGVKSYQTTATFTIKSEGGGEAVAEGTLLLNNSLFGTFFEGSLSAGEQGDFSGTQDGITVVYSKAEGSNQYINNSQIRLYPGNTIAVSIGQGKITELEFTVVQNKNNKEILASTGTVGDYVWTGSASEVTFSTNSGSGHIQLSAIKVKTDNPSDVSMVSTTSSHTAFPVVYTLSGVRVDGQHLRPGVYIYNGKKILVK